MLFVCGEAVESVLVKLSAPVKPLGWGFYIKRTSTYKKIVEAAESTKLAPKLKHYQDCSFVVVSGLWSLADILSHFDSFVFSPIGPSGPRRHPKK